MAGKGVARATGPFLELLEAEYVGSVLDRKTSWQVLCTYCRHFYTSPPFMDDPGDAECEHPLERVRDGMDSVWNGGDCWGFRLKWGAASVIPRRPAQVSGARIVELAALGSEHRHLLLERHYKRMNVRKEEVYLAARYSRRLEMVEYAAQLRALGVRVTSTWIDGHHETRPNIDHDGTEAEQKVWADEDVRDIRRSSLLLAFTELPGVGSNRGGRHWEAGFATGIGLPVHIIGPRESPFYCRGPVRQHADWAAFLVWLTRCDTPQELLSDSPPVTSAANPE